ncbi:MFS transporter [Lentisphaera profundi]|uniref:MFS transporter n=1 Tax=Lentisphaera profundi TaxID=1658616 RepID=A0ABY7VPN2_9BACT|nr:MFS transporter [Lentisphaera profundi]WDE95662.1 MFS transporter [Lentisphaera profundi]
MNSESSNKTPFDQVLAFGAGGIIPIALFNIAGQLMGLIGNISLGLSAFLLGTIMIIPRLWDAVSDPIMGNITDNTRSRWGRRRPYILIGGCMVAVSFILMWWIPQGEWIRSIFPEESAYQWFQLAYILFWLIVFFTSCTVFEIPHGALGMEMSSDSHERTRLFSAKSFMGNLFAMGTPWLFALANMEFFKGVGGNEADGMRYVSILVAVVLIPLCVWSFLKLREPGFEIAKKQKKLPFWKEFRHTMKNKNFLILIMIIFTLAMGFNFVGLLGYYIPIFYIFEGNKDAAGPLLGFNGTIWALTGLLAVFPLNYLAKRSGKKTTLIIAISLMVCAQLSKIVCYNPSYPYLIVIPTILLSIGMLFFFTLGSSMVGDICDEDDLKSGQRAEGSYYSIFWWFIKMGTAFASFVTGLLITFVDFNEVQVKSSDIISGKLKESLSLVESKDKYNQDTLKTQVTATIAELDHFILSLNEKEVDEHNTQLLVVCQAIRQELKSIDLTKDDIPSIQSDLSSSLWQSQSLTLQSPQTLFWMRAVEIVLPLLLCAISLLFTLYYPLDEERCLEIQAALAERNKKLD